MGKHGRTDPCISRIDIMKPVNLDFVNLLLNNNYNNNYLLMRKRMFENIRRGLIKEALIDAEIMAKETPSIESRLIVSRLWLCLGEISNALKEINMCIECSESCNMFLEITKIDAGFIEALIYKSNNMDIVRQDYVVKSLISSNEEYLWVDFMPYIISLLNNNQDEAEDWLKLLKTSGNNAAKNLAEEVLTSKFNLFISKNEYKGLYHFMEWVWTRDEQKLEKTLQSTYFPDGTYIIAKSLLKNRQS